METKLDNLIQKIKQEGVEEAKKQSEDIIEQAGKKADGIVKDAENKCQDIILDGNREAEALKKNGQEALRQSARDVILSLRQDIIALFDCVLKKEISTGLSEDTLKKIIVKMVENFKKEEGLDIEILLSKQDKNTLEHAVSKSFKEEVKKGVTFKVSPNIDKGFRIGQKGKNFYYDFTDEAIAEAFKLYLNPKIAEILNSKSKTK